MTFTRNIMPKRKNTRKARFRAALGLAGMSMSQWARAEGFTPGHVSQVLDNKRESASLDAKIAAFTEKELQKIRDVA